MNEIYEKADRVYTAKSVKNYSATVEIHTVIRSEMVYPYGFCNTADYKTIYFINTRTFFRSRPDINDNRVAVTANHALKISNRVNATNNRVNTANNHVVKIVSHDDKIASHVVKIVNPVDEIASHVDTIDDHVVKIDDHVDAIDSHDDEIVGHDDEIGSHKSKIDGLFSENINSGIVNKSHEGRIYSRNATVDGKGSEFKLQFEESQRNAN